MIIRRLSVTTFVIVGLVATSVGSASAATVSPSKWAPKFCTAIDDYQTTISETTEQMQTALQSVTDLSEARGQIVSYLGSMVAAAKTAKRGVERAGVPSSPNGAKIEAKFVDALDESADIFTDAKAQAAKISTTDAAAFAKEGKQVGTDLQDAGTELSASFGGIGKLDKGKKLEAAVRAADECAFLT